MIDPPELDPGFSTAAMNRIWSAANRVSCMLRVEVALAEAAASTGSIPVEASRQIRDAARQPVADAAALLAEGWLLGTPVVPLVALLRSRVAEHAARHVHYGATSQDILDTALVLQLRASFCELRKSLALVADELHARLQRHSHAWVMARTLLQPALPIKLAVRLAHWLDPIVNQLEALEVIHTALPIQLGGPVGDLSSFGDAADALARQFAQLLQLRVPRVAWHTDRAVVVHAIAVAMTTAHACATVANNLILLSQPGIGEVQADPAQSGVSSSMPNKRNPQHAVRALAALRACQGASAIVTAAHPHELERAVGSWQVEWFAVPLAMQAAAATVEATLAALRASSFDGERARANLDQAQLTGDAHAQRIVERVAARYRALRGPKDPWSCE